MNQQNQPPAMNQKIFELGLDVETVSAYLLCCGIADTNTSVSTKNLFDRWTSSKDALLKSLDNLEKMNIISRIISDREGRYVFKLTSVKDWKLS